MLQKLRKIILEGKSFKENDLGINKDDIILDLNANDGFESFLSNDVVVSLNITISEELKMEGIFRDLIRHIQLMRKEADFNIDDRIVIAATFPKELEGVINTNK